MFFFRLLLSLNACVFFFGLCVFVNRYMYLGLSNLSWRLTEFRFGMALSNPTLKRLNLFKYLTLPQFYTLDDVLNLVFKNNYIHFRQDTGYIVEILNTMRKTMMWITNTFLSKTGIHIQHNMSGYIEESACLRLYQNEVLNVQILNRLKVLHSKEIWKEYRLNLLQI